jgi:hypothetical protein
MSSYARWQSQVKYWSVAPDKVVTLTSVSGVYTQALANSGVWCAGTGAFMPPWLEDTVYVPLCAPLCKGAEPLQCAVPSEQLHPRAT